MPGAHDAAPKLPAAFAAPPHSGPVECLGLTFESDEARREYFLARLTEKLPELLGSGPTSPWPKTRTSCGYPIRRTTPRAPTRSWPTSSRTTAGRTTPTSPITASRSPSTSAPARPTPLYRAHGYHTKVPHLAIVPSILHYNATGRRRSRRLLRLGYDRRRRPVVRARPRPPTAGRWSSAGRRRNATRRRGAPATWSSATSRRPPRSSPPTTTSRSTRASSTPPPAESPPRGRACRPTGSAGVCTGPTTRTRGPDCGRRVVVVHAARVAFPAVSAAGAGAACGAGARRASRCCRRRRPRPPPSAGRRRVARGRRRPCWSGACASCTPGGPG